ncbi:pleckstrin homology domain-containing family M member 1 isoform X1 [Bufo bufo]|uniref:pleckstrin homology domain-containing family M member 1 isoform X1 n=1 Tax=Bufo bufo TaxID=8384 RepID=UPI001ABE3EDE|nr:pleckstrin homology domain-containing family M member 1 isoform X1 [Bufo bufo]XP_040290630.1 pleckstrin homology domain-containing family M member 1 isoform X1 [Bufo bufo]
MYTPQATLPDHRDVKQNIAKKLSSSLRALQMRYVTTDDVITSDDDDAISFCVALEAIFIHGLKVKFIRTQAGKRRNKGRQVPLPQPAFWPLLKAITHRDVTTQLEKISYINSDVGRCRSWLRLALNESLMECYFLTLQREKSHLLEYYQPFALLLDAEDCDVVLSYLQGLSSLTFSLSYKSSILNEWTASPLTLSGLWLENTERVVQYEPHRRKSLDSVSQSSGSDDTNNSMIRNTKRQLESSSLSLDNSTSSSQLSSSLGSDEQPLNQAPVPPASPQISAFSRPLPDTCDVVEGAHADMEDTDAETPDTTSQCPLYQIPIPEILKSDEEYKEAEEIPAADTPKAAPLNDRVQEDDLTVSEPLPPAPPTHEVDAYCIPVTLGSRSLSAEASPAAELPKSQSWISEDDFQTECPVIALAESRIGNLASHLPDATSSESLKPPGAAFHVVHRRQIGLPNPFRGLLMLGSLERKHALGLYKPYYCELTPYELRLCLEGEEQNCAENCSLLRCESVGPAHSDGRFDVQFSNKRLYLRAPSKNEAQDWVDRIQEAVQKFRPPQDDGWEILHCPKSPQNAELPDEGVSPCRVFDWTFQVEVESDALKESILYMKVHKSWMRFMFSLSERALKCFQLRSSEKSLYNVYTVEMVKDILPDSSLGSPSCFRLVTTKGSLQLQAENAAEARTWRELVRAVFLELEDDAVIFLRTANFHIKPHIRDHLLFQYLLHIPTERGLDTQNFKCAGCHKQIGLQFGKAKLCAFSGLYYCDLCHQDEVSIIPSRIVHNWDLMERAVSRPALNFLKMVQDEPIFNLKYLNDRLYRHTQTMCEISQSREKLRLLGEYLMTCRSGALQELSTSLDQREHLLDCAHTYSMQDLKQIADGAFEYCLQSALDFASSHVYRCDLCSQRGFICQICNQDDIIYPFQFDTTTRCGECKAVFHKPCKTPATLCPRCERRRKFQNQRVRM